MIVAALLWAPPAAAAPIVETGGCPYLARDELAAAIAAELPGADVVRVTIACEPGGVAAVQVLRDGRAPLARAVDFRDVPPDLRNRLVALAVAEMTVAIPPEPVAAAPEPVADAPEPVADAPEPVADAPEPVEILPEPVRIVPEPLEDERRTQIGLATGLRLYGDGGAPVPSAAVELGVGRWNLDLFGAATSGVDPLGATRVRVGGVGLAAQLLSRGSREASVALAVRGAAGAAAVDATAVHPDVVATPAWTPYLELGPRLEGRLESHRVAVAFRLGVVGAIGPVAEAEDRVVARLSGVAGVAELSLGVLP